MKNPYSRGADQLAIYKHDRGVELGSTEKQLQLSGQDLGPPDFKSGALTIWPDCPLTVFCLTEDCQHLHNVGDIQRFARLWLLREVWQRRTFLSSTPAEKLISERAPSLTGILHVHK